MTGTRARALALLCCAQFLLVLDVTIVAVALPALRSDLGFSSAGLQWVISAYTLAFGGLLVAAGRAVVAAGALALVTLSSAGFAVSFVLMGAGLGAAAVASTASGTQALGEDEQGIASGVLNATAQIGTALGLAAIVTLAAPLGYQAGFVAAAALALGVALTRWWPRSRRRPTTPPR